MIEGMLWEMGKDPMSVQVMCNDAEPPQYLLNDESGVFLSRPLPTERRGTGIGRQRLLSGEPSTIEEALEENRRLEGKVSQFEEELASRPSQHHIDLSFLWNEQR